MAERAKSLNEGGQTTHASNGEFDKKQHDESIEAWWIIIGSSNGLLPVQCLGIAWTNVNLLVSGTLAIKCEESG